MVCAALPVLTISTRAPVENGIGSESVITVSEPVICTDIGRVSKGAISGPCPKSGPNGRLTA